MSTYTPDAWVIVAITTPEYGTIHKVLAGWYGGYAGSDSWKLSSGVEAVNDKDTHYEIVNSSGSVYQCYKNCERLTGYTASIFASFDKDISEMGDGSSIQIVNIVDLKLYLAPENQPHETE